MNIILALFLVLCFAVFAPSDATAKTWTIDERQEQLMKDINAAQEKKALTAKEGDKLRKMLAKVSKKKAKWKTDKTRELSSDEKLTLEGDLNKISVQIKALQLEKRTEEPAKKD
ncbi:MAG: hypothetical protein IPG59_16965 [Candidatus Melainabacteria bacterium]|nr:MAG: hypothetical protein IPG59_16965 [Candidatus Melainabacteria bacterium]